MAKLKLTLACTQTDRSAPLLDGRVVPEGCELIAMPGQTQDIFRRVLDDQAFDIAEMSMSSQIVQVQPRRWIITSPFPSTCRGHSGTPALYIRTDRGIERPEDLAG